MSYVRLKHTLAEIALDALEHPARARTPELLLAYTRRSRENPDVAVVPLAHAAGMTATDAVRELLGTGLFDGSMGPDRIALCAPFRPFASYLRRQAAGVRIAQHLLASSRRSGLPDEIWRAAALFNAGLFFECHEYLENVWRAAPPVERAFYHGLVQAAAGCYHLEKGNAHGAGTLLRKALAKLEPYAPVHCEVDVAAFGAGLHRALARLDRAGSRGVPGRGGLPTLPLVEGPPRARRGRVRACGAPAVCDRSRPAGGRPPR